MLSLRGYRKTIQRSHMALHQLCKEYNFIAGCATHQPAGNFGPLWSKVPCCVSAGGCNLSLDHRGPKCQGNPTSDHRGPKFQKKTTSDHRGPKFQGKNNFRPPWSKVSEKNNFRPSWSKVSGKNNFRPSWSKVSVNRREERCSIGISDFVRGVPGDWRTDTKAQTGAASVTGAAGRKGRDQHQYPEPPGMRPIFNLYKQIPQNPACAGCGCQLPDWFGSIKGERSRRGRTGLPAFQAS